MPPRTRYAPSPTGYLHLGHAAHIIWVWGAAQAIGAEVVLRIEDHDRGRCRPVFESALIEDLEWLGFEPANRVGARSDYRQSDCNEVYAAALARLSALGQVYRCDCTRREIAEHSPLSSDGERCYSGRCRDRDVAEDRPHCLRLQLEPGAESFCDGLLGPQQQDPSRQCGDLMLRDRHGQWTYQFAVAVDDLRQGIDVVIRGEDLLASSGRQIRLARLLGRDEPPAYLHHPLIKDLQGVKLSKKTASAPIRSMRESGLSAAQVVGEAAFRVGLLEANRPAEWRELRDRISERLAETGSGRRPIC